MDSKEYIASGILELYVADALDQQERAAVEEQLKLHPELRIEVEAIEQALEDYAVAQAIVPSSGLKQRVLAGIPDTAKPAVKTEAKVLPMTPALRWALAASVALILVMGAVILSLQSKVNGLGEQVASLSAQQAELTTIRSARTLKISLAGVESHTDADAVVYWDTNNKEVMIDCVDLPQADEGHEYQLWALDNGKPVDAGLFGNGSSLKKLKKIDHAQAFAVTLEPKGGSVNPTMDQMYLYTEL